MTRDDNTNAVSDAAYSSVLFWYYAQAQLRAQAGNPDVVRSFWQDQGGNDDSIYAWAAARFGGMGQMYHRFMIDNYLQTLNAPSSVPSEPNRDDNNPYYDSYTKWNDPLNNKSGGTSWFVDDLGVARNGPNKTSVFIRPNEIVTARLNQSITRTGDIGDPSTATGTKIQALGTRYYAIDADPIAPVTSTLEVGFQLDNSSGTGPYQVTLLDVKVNKNDLKRPPIALNKAVTLDGNTGTVVRLPNFHEDDRRVVIVVTKIYDYSSPFQIKASLLKQATRPVATSQVFSPNPDVDRTSLINTAA